MLSGGGGIEPSPTIDRRVSGIRLYISSIHRFTQV